ncbi:UPF0280 family protein [Telmatospirillum siberiense]|uniref:Uncharacterized protein n=1 Tax=Telmatospirillum siberiense TaxID=382514 RepID=A0A2N3PQF7_9PROT|nr:UPF0280 family protein [Telmatospirillum siberiense]PKU22624.1 hypothetical protein CWS72_20790 [Telmatospirillum siberiense]
MTARATLLADRRRLHLQHGPIDLVVEAFGEPAEVARAYVQAEARFHPILPVLAAQLPILRSFARPGLPVDGAVARAMLGAVLPLADHFITPMAAVAGAVADHVLAAMLDGRRLSRAYVNNGGDIAFHLASGRSFRIGVVSRIDGGAVDAHAVIGAAQPVRGIATSGAGGRSFSLGIADSVTVLGRNAAEADAAATVIANAVDLPGHPAVSRRPARDLDPDSDLGDRSVTVAVGPLDEADCRRAIAAGVEKARILLRRGLIGGAKLSLRGVVEVVGGGVFLPSDERAECA